MLQASHAHIVVRMHARGRLCPRSTRLPGVDHFRCEAPLSVALLAAGSVVGEMLCCVACWFVVSSAKLCVASLTRGRCVVNVCVGSCVLESVD